MADTTEKSGAVGAFDQAGRVDIICIPLRDVGPTAEKLYHHITVLSMISCGGPDISIIMQYSVKK